MAQLTWRTSDELAERVRRAAEERGRSMNDYVTAVLNAATDPDLAGGEAAALRERLSLAGLAVPRGPRRRRPSRSEVASARAAASRGTPLSKLVEEGR
ncbi:MAG: transcriptional regulator [Acidimicrobiales bacterium]